MARSDIVSVLSVYLGGVGDRFIILEGQEIIRLEHISRAAKGAMRLPAR